MRNTEKYFENLKAWRNDMRQIEKTYQDGLIWYAPYRGSEGYNKALCELDRVRAEAVEATRKEYSSRFKDIIEAMKRTYANKPMTAPTTEQVNLLSALKLRTSIGRDELRQAANALRGCPVALEALREIGKSLGVPVGITQEIGGDTVASNLRTLEKRTAQMLSLNKADDRRTHANGLLSDSYDLFQIDTDCVSESDCARVMGLVTDFAGFAAAVNETN